MEPSFLCGFAPSGTYGTKGSKGRESPSLIVKTKAFNIQANICG
jgi:hypothetical protein